MAWESLSATHSKARVPEPAVSLNMYGTLFINKPARLNFSLEPSYAEVLLDRQKKEFALKLGSTGSRIYAVGAGHSGLAVCFVSFLKEVNVSLPTRGKPYRSEIKKSGDLLVFSYAHWGAKPL
jgi:hypothetical protein